MKASIKYAIISLLYEQRDGLWEYEIYQRLKPHYSKSSLCAIREELISFNTVGWVATASLREYQGRLLRKFKLEPQHVPFIEHQLDVASILAELRSTPTEQSNLVGT
ncbi:hypothetical protein [Alicyclobacillus fastidiosus]|uniref:PadR family transcriptional regulator n=1 Tax=Alicyclobacillus fastidiosus TaxID=392011 RepID=A0ABV5AB61_9BACL|nr:hypothetical protein [Alicyclobacillus fastidiosus]WEH11922.1 hypothetical protein PYS47_12260 [Alicyclobacillus fastidiosus]